MELELDCPSQSKQKWENKDCNRESEIDGEAAAEFEKHHRGTKI